MVHGDSAQQYIRLSKQLKKKDQQVVQHIGGGAAQGRTYNVPANINQAALDELLLDDQLQQQRLKLQQARKKEQQRLRLQQQARKKEQLRIAERQILFSDANLRKIYKIYHDVCNRPKLFQQYKNEFILSKNTLIHLYDEILLCLLNTQRRFFIDTDIKLIFKQFYDRAHKIRAETRGLFGRMGLGKDHRLNTKELLQKTASILSKIKNSAPITIQDLDAFITDIHTYQKLNEQGRVQSVPAYAIYTDPNQLKLILVDLLYKVYLVNKQAEKTFIEFSKKWSTGGGGAASRRT